MPRYMTPSKIALLCLVTVYTDGRVPNPAVVPLLSFLLSHLFPFKPGVSLEDNGADKAHTISISAFESATSVLQSEISERSIWDVLLAKLWSLDCANALEGFMDKLADIVQKPREKQLEERSQGKQPDPSRTLLARTSPLGAFVRRARLEFTKLQFHDMLGLWKGFVKYRMPTFHQLSKKQTASFEEAVDSNLAMLSVSLSSPLARVVYGSLEDDMDINCGISTLDMSRLLEFQVSEMQSSGVKLPDDMKERFQYMLTMGFSVPELAYYVKFLDAWKSGDYHSSFEYLHRYFDYTMKSQDRTFYQYALFNLAILQADFGYYQEAVSAVQESITIARETQDMSCLNFCMSWLYHFGKAFPDEVGHVRRTGMLGGEKEGLAFLQAKARESEIWNLLSTSFLSEAKLELQNGGNLASVFENLVKVSHLNLTKSTVNSFGPQLALQGSLYARLGLPHACCAVSEIYQQSYMKELNGPLEDLQVIVFLSSQMFAQRGQYDLSVQRLNEIPEINLTMKSRQLSYCLNGILQLQRCLNRHELVAAEHILNKLKQCVTTEEVVRTVAFLEIELLIQKGNYSAALKAIESFTSSLRPETFDVASQVTLMNLKARIFIKTGQPERSFSLVMRASSIAHHTRFLPGLWESIINLSTVLVSFNEFQAATQILESIIPQLLTCEDVKLIARAYSLMVSNLIGIAGQNQIKQAHKKHYVTEAMAYAERAYQAFAGIEDIREECATIVKMATIKHAQGDMAGANELAGQYLELKQEMSSRR